MLRASQLGLQQISSHGLFDLNIEAEGDTWIDDHHTNEDLGTLEQKSRINYSLCCYTGTSLDIVYDAQQT